MVFLEDNWETHKRKSVLKRFRLPLSTHKPPLLRGPGPPGRGTRTGQGGPGAQAERTGRQLAPWSQAHTVPDLRGTEAPPLSERAAQARVPHHQACLLLLSLRSGPPVPSGSFRATCSLPEPELASPQTGINIQHSLSVQAPTVCYLLFYIQVYK